MHSRRVLFSIAFCPFQRVCGWRLWAYVIGFFVTLAVVDVALGLDASRSRSGARVVNAISLRSRSAAAWRPR
jgi:nitrogen fixation protein FixH